MKKIAFITYLCLIAYGAITGDVSLQIGFLSLIALFIWMGIFKDDKP